jgi:hypothetical protein
MAHVKRRSTSIARARTSDRAAGRAFARTPDRALDFDRTLAFDCALDRAADRGPDGARVRVGFGLLTHGQ